MPFPPSCKERAALSSLPSIPKLICWKLNIQTKGPVLKLAPIEYDCLESKSLVASLLPCCNPTPSPLVLPAPINLNFQCSYQKLTDSWLYPSWLFEPLAVLSNTSPSSRVGFLPTAQSSRLAPEFSTPTAQRSIFYLPSSLVETGELVNYIWWHTNCRS